MTSGAPSYRCLVVEDSASMRELMGFALRRIPRVEVVEASNGLEALQQLSAGRFDLVVTDINMPVMDGLKLVGRIRADDRYAAVPIVVVTTESGGEDRQRAMSLGANAYVLKPIQAAQVERTVKQLLGMK
jgi:two-component system chemotaxis response regulator CheY